MKSLFVAASAGLLAAGAAHAGGLDRSGQPVSALFESGNFAEISFGSVSPDVSGVFNHPLAGALQSGNVTPDYTQVGLAFKYDVNERLSLALILDQPFGANVSYDRAGYPLAGTTAELTSQGITALARYRLNDRFSFHGGVRAISMDGAVRIQSSTGVYDATYDQVSDLGYVLGAAYERPDIALRVALTYATATEFSTATTIAGVGTVGTMDFTMPQSVNLDFQTGIAANTLLFGSVRWADWTATELNSPGYPGNPLVDYEQDRMTYTVGIGRRFSDSFSGAISVTYEEQQGLLVSNLSPTDGVLGVQLGGSYTVGNVEISAGVRFLQVGDATTKTIGAQFTDNTAVAYGLSVGYHF